MEQKISVLTDEFGDPEFENVAEYLSSKDFEYVELRGVWIKNVLNLDDIDIGEIKDILQSNGLKVSCISGGLLKCSWPGPPGEQETMEDGTPIIEYQMRLADNAIKVADALGTKFIRAFGFYRLAMFEEEMWPDWIDALQQLVKKAEQAGKIVVLENEHGCILSGLESIRRAFSQVTSPNCRLLFDPGNLLAGGERVTPENIDELYDLTAYVHVKDRKNGRWCLIGEGDVGWREIIDSFVQRGYDSFWSVETHMSPKEKKWENTARNLEILREMLS